MTLLRLFLFAVIITNGTLLADGTLLSDGLQVSDQGPSMDPDGASIDAGVRIDPEGRY